MREHKAGGFSCALGCWAMAGGAGLLTFVLLIVLGDYRFFGAIFLAGILTGVLGLAFQSIFCKALPAPGETRPGAERGLRTTAPEDFSAVSVTYADAKRRAQSEGKAPPHNPYEDGPARAPAHPSSAFPAPAAPAPTGTAGKPAKPAPEDRAGSTDAASMPAAGGDAGAGQKPETLSAPREGGADDLKKIKGVGPKLEEMLNGMGFYHFDQIANWTAAEVAWVDENLEGFKGRVSRDDWVAQAKALAAGETPS